MPIEEYVVCTLVIKDTAIIPAASAEDAVDLYMMPEELANGKEDMMIWCATAEEFRSAIDKGKQESTPALDIVGT